MNRDELRGHIVRCGLTNIEVAERMGIALVTFQKKLNGKSAWRLTDIKAIKEILGLTDEQVRVIFFDAKVA